MASKPKKANSNTSPGGDTDKAKKAAVMAELIKSRDEAARGYNLAGKIVLGTAAVGFLGRLSGKVAGATATSSGAAEEARILAKSNPSTSKTMNVPKNTNVITSGKGGSANATSGVKKVIIQKSAARSAASAASNAARGGARVADEVLTANQIMAKGGVAGATAVQAIRGVGSKPKKKK